MIVDGFHGTTESAVQKIIDTGMREGRRQGLWLGPGRYFFQDARSLALEWARKVIRWKGLLESEPLAVVHARIDLTGCLDLVDNIYWNDIREIYHALKDDLASKRITQLGFDANFEVLSKEEERKLGRNLVDGRVMTVTQEIFAQYFMARNKALTTIRAAFAEGKPIHPTSWLFDGSNIMICVIDPVAFAAPLAIA
jgi:hypothetical protein